MPRANDGRVPHKKIPLSSVAHYLLNTQSIAKPGSLLELQYPEILLRSHYIGIIY